MRVVAVVSEPALLMLESGKSYQTISKLAKLT